MNLTSYEQETIINYNQEENEANIYTHDKALIKKLLVLCKKFPTEFRLVSGDKYSKTFDVPKKYVLIQSPKTLSDEQRKELSERAKNTTNFGIKKAK